MSNEELRAKWADFDAGLRDYNDEETIVKEEKKRVIQEVMHDTAPKKREDLHEVIEKDWIDEDSWN